MKSGGSVDPDPDPTFRVICPRAKDTVSFSLKILSISLLIRDLDPLSCLLDIYYQDDPEK